MPPLDFRLFCLKDDLAAGLECPLHVIELISTNKFALEKGQEITVAFDAADVHPIPWRRVLGCLRRLGSGNCRTCADILRQQNLWDDPCAQPSYYVDASPWSKLRNK
jgi:hypothetical protein